MSSLKYTLAYLKVNRMIKLGMTSGRFTEDELCAKMDELTDSTPVMTSDEQVKWYLERFAPEYRKSLLMNSVIFERATEAWNQEVRIPAEQKNIAEFIAFTGAPEEITPEEIVMWAVVASL